MLHRGEVSNVLWPVSVFNSSGEVQSELFTEGITCILVQPSFYTSQKVEIRAVIPSTDRQTARFVSNVIIISRCHGFLDRPRVLR